MLATIGKDILMIIIGLATGLIESGGTVAFISIIGIIPIMAHHTKTQHYMLLYENMIMLGTILASIATFWQLHVPIGRYLEAIFAFAFGIFVGVYIIALAEVLDVLPIFNRRLKLKKGIVFVVLALALGKVVGSLCYFIYPYFMKIYLS